MVAPNTPPLRAVLSLLAATAALLTAHGLLNTLVAVRAAHEGFSTTLIGLTTSAYFIGYMVGARVMPGLLARIGHVRTFAACAALATIAVLLLPLLPYAVAWLLLRGLMGFALVGLSNVIETWLAAQAGAAERSRVLGSYMTVNLLGLAAGPLLLGFGEPGSPVLFSIAALLLAATALPVTLTKLAPPPVHEQQKMPMATVAAAAPTAIAGVFLIGMSLGSFWGLGAVFAEQRGLERGGVGLLMAITVLGGALLQWPIGRWSDRGDRRTVMATVGVVAALALVGAAFAEDTRLMMALFAVAGGGLFSVYPLCMAHLFDRVAADRALSACSTLLVANGVGAALGPVLVGAAMQMQGAAALPLAMAVCLSLIATVAAWRRISTGFLGTHAQRFLPLLRTSPAALRLLTSAVAKRPR